MEDEVALTAQKVFGVQYLYPWQRLVIANILDASQWATNPVLGRDDVPTKQIVLLPTGAGKSLCFMVPAVLLTGPTLIFYPLLALMSDQERRIEESGIGYVTFRGGQSKEEREENFRKIQSGAKIILANPEVLQNKSLVERLSRCGIAHIAIDEAHCVSEWGDSFRPAYLTLGQIIKDIGCPVVTAFTATASETVLNRVSEVLFDGNAHVVRGASDRPNIRYHVKYAYCKDKAVAELAVTWEKPMIIFCSSRKRTERMASFLRCYMESENIRFYHAGLSREEKSLCEKWFYDKKDAILVSTCAFGMGVDKKDIKTVVHLDAPTTAEAYIQEAGRGGRDGSVANAILVWSPADNKDFEAFPPNSRERVLYDFANTTGCRRQVLLDALGGEEVVCAGCDICDNTADFIPRDKERVMNFAKRYPLQFSLDDFTIKLEGTFAKEYNDSLPSPWEQRDLSLLVCTLLAEKSLLRSEKILTKNLLTITEKSKNPFRFRKKQH
ncbi:MAG: ATP-dependent DNA helicase RecQ [Spirochaetaceae bacterium]|nr:ATP-dependent DNA helicase RecQ [Spirochaetaceae bacterium]